MSGDLWSDDYSDLDRECAWCSGKGNFHAPGCRAAATGRSSLQTQRERTDQMRREMYGTTAPAPRNPFSPEDWNVTEQGALYRADKDLAERMAMQAGVRIGATKPRKLTEREQVERKAMLEGRTTAPSSFGGVYRTKEPPKDERTEVQKRFDALAEEFGNNGE